MKKLLAVVLALAMMLSLAACNQKSADGTTQAAPIDQEFVGNWVGVGGDVFDIQMDEEEASAYTLDVAADGTVVLSIDGESMNCTGSSSGDTLTFNEPVLEITNTAVLTDNMLYVENIMDFGINVYMVKEGDTSYDPTQFMPEELQAVVGTWQSYQVLNALDEDISDEIPADALFMMFYDDSTATIYIGDETYPEEKWVMVDEIGWLEDSECDLMWELIDGELVVDYYDAEDNGYYFTCEKID